MVLENEAPLRSIETPPPMTLPTFLSLFFSPFLSFPPQMSHFKQWLPMLTQVPGLVKKKKNPKKQENKLLNMGYCSSSHYRNNS